MTWFDQIQVPEGGDEYDEWAATEEYAMRYRRAERQRDGVSTGLRKAAASINKLNAVLAGDPSVPKLPKIKEIE